MVGFYLLGDMGSGNDYQIMVAKSLSININNNKEKNLFVCGLGDNIYDEGCSSIEDEQFIQKFEEPYQDIDNNIKFYMCLGNHYYGWDLWDKKERSKHQINYAIQSQKDKKKWFMPSNYYTFDKGNISFFVVDTNFENQTENEIKDQLSFMIKKINKSKKKWKIVYGHHTLKSIGGHGNCEDLMGKFFKKLIEESNFDVYMCGHDHNKQVINTKLYGKNLLLIVCGTGGAILDKTINLSNIDTKDIEFFSTNYGFAYCEQNKNKLEFKFYNELNELEFYYPLTRK